MARDKLQLPRDRELLAFIFARFIDGELTGLKEGLAIQFAPTLRSADFLARQIRDEIRHAQMYKALYAYVNPGAKVTRTPFLLRALMAPLSGRHWAEHCFLDKAVGERWVLHLMRRLIEDTDDRRITRTLQVIARDEEQHIKFGEQQTRLYAARSRFWRFYLWGLFLRVDLAMAVVYRLLRAQIKKRYSASAARMLSAFFEESREKIAAECAELLQVPLRRSFLQLVICQMIFCCRWPFTGWFRSPRFQDGQAAEKAL